MPRIFGFATLCLLAACDLGGERNNAALRSAAGGEVALADGTSLKYSITSEQFKRWDGARRGIKRRIAARFGEILQPDAPSEQSIERAVAYLESEPSALRSIERAGMTVRAFVVMTVALEQEMRLASGLPATRQREPMPYEFPPIDTTFIAPQPVVPAVPETVATDTVPRVDTSLYPPPKGDSVPLPPPTMRKDSAARPAPTIFRRDTVIRDSSKAPPSRPVIPDTLPDTAHGPLPPDSLSDA